MKNSSNYLSKYIPNSITILSLCCGLTSIKFSINEEWKIAIFLIIFASVFDFFDGWFARKLKGGTNFGAELDSLSDFISFGVAPCILVYYWSLYELKSLGWSIALFFSACAALRLARFTADIYLTSRPIDPNLYFTGVPSPAAAGLSLLPLFIFFEFNFSIVQNAYLNLFNLFFIGFLMVSKIPTISLKSINFSKKFTPWIILLIVIICIGLISNLWLTLVALVLTYLLSILYTILTNISIKS
jgi:CDP-diacylglycerol--serine O-phosphatidyltransferase